jgi:putative peptide zinc metalloprotease protein
LQPYGLAIIGQLLGVAMIGSLVVWPLVRLARFVLEPARSDSMNFTRAALGIGVAGVALASILAVPLPYFVTCSVEMQPRGATSVYVDVPGQVRSICVPSGPVELGQVIAQLDDVDARIALERLAGQRERLAVRVEAIRQRAHIEDQALLELAHAEEALAALDVQLARRREELDRMTIRAPVAGVLVPPPTRKRDQHERTTLVAWSGRPLDNRNLGAHLEASTLLGRIALPGKFEAVLAVPQEEMDFVQPGQHVQIFLEQLPGSDLGGEINHIASEELKAVSDRLSRRTGGTLATRTTASGIERPIGVVYQASVPIDDETDRLVVGGTGTAKIHAGWQPLATRLWRSLCRTFRFEM